MPQFETSVLQRRRVLIVDPNERHREILRRQMAEWCLTVDIAADETEAMRALNTTTSAGAPYDVVLIDAATSSASQLAHAIKSGETLRGIGVIGLTLIGGVLNGEAARQAGFDVCLAKPVRKGRLFDAVFNALRRETDPASESTPALTVPASSTGKDFAHARILLAEDNAVNRRVAMGQLRMLGCAAKCVTNGREVLEELRQQTYDLILMDCQMPELDGYETTEEIRQWECDPARPRSWQTPMYIVALTANAMGGDREKCLAAGMDNYVAKPVLLPGLRAVLEQWQVTNVSGARAVA
jgi:CheY-like chemotaxis protein